MTDKVIHIKILVYTLILTLVLGATGCASNKSNPPSLLESEYKRVMERQKQIAAADQGTVVPKDLPEMTAERYEQIGDNHIRQNNAGLAFVNYEKSRRLDPRRSSVHYKMGILFLNKGLQEDALKEFEEILKNDPKYTLAYEGLGQVFFARGDWKKARENFIQTLSLDPKMWQAHSYLGIIYNHQKNFDAAIKEYEAALVINNKSSALYNNAGISYYMKGDYEKAKEHYIKALRIEPDNKKVYNNLALALCKMGSYDNAFEAFKKGGNEASAYNNLGYIYITEKKYQEAIKTFQRAIELNPKYYVNAHENMKRAESALKAQSQ